MPPCFWGYNRRMFEQLPDWQSKLSTRAVVSYAVLFAFALGFQLGRLVPRATQIFEDPSYLLNTLLTLGFAVALLSEAISRIRQRNSNS
jgi:hypothetical protein